LPLLDRRGGHSDADCMLQLVLQSGFVPYRHANRRSKQLCLEHTVLVCTTTSHIMQASVQDLCSSVGNTSAQSSVCMQEDANRLEIANKDIAELSKQSSWLQQRVCDAKQAQLDTDAVHQETVQARPCLVMF